MRLALLLALVLAVVAVVSMDLSAGTCLRDRDKVCDPTVCPNCDCVGCDADGDGICDECGTCCNPDAPDDDGDGIPNGQDDDYVPPQDGSGRGR